MSTITPKQIQVVQTARRRLQLDDADFRELLRKVGSVRPDETGHVSCKALTQKGFEAVMAHLERMGFKMRPGQGGGYWRERQFRRRLLCSDREAHLIRELAGRQERYPLGALCRRHSGGHTDQPEQLTAKQAHGLIEALKQINARERRGQGSSAAPGKEAAGTDAGISQDGWQIYGSPTVSGGRETDGTADWFD